MKRVEDHLSDYESHLILKNFSDATRRSYVSILGHFLRYRKDNRLGGRLNQEQAKKYILYRYGLGKKWQTINSDYSSLRKYYREVLEVPWSIRKLPRPRKEHYLPRILSKQDVVKLIESAPLYKHQVFLTFVYGTGVRLSESLNVRMEDIDGDRLQVRITRGKGSKDRYVKIPQCLLDLLRNYYRRCRPEVYLFNGLKCGSRYSNRAAQWSIGRARKLSGITKGASIHTLRHCFATHHLESGTDLVYLQMQMGHKHLKTTARYVHLCMDQYRQINHPLSQMDIKYR